jgi:hypothetical protein
MSNVRQLFNPSQQRINTVREWFHDQADAADNVCALSVSITADNQILTRAMGVDDALAVVVIAELRKMIACLEESLPAEFKAIAMVNDQEGKQAPKVSALRLV